MLDATVCEDMNFSFLCQENRVFFFFKLINLTF